MNVTLVVIIAVLGFVLTIYGMVSKTKVKDPKYIGGDAMLLMSSQPVDDTNGVKRTTLLAGRVYDTHEYHNIPRRV